ncbi:MAG: hypothetical protein ABFQ64_01790 [Campylobacterota bacterium]
MKKIILTAVLLAGALQATDTVHYDTKDSGNSTISKPNHPSTGLYK